MQFVMLIVWLCLSNALLMIPGIILLESGERFWGILLAAGLPALRMVARYCSPRGYYLMGYNDGPGGDLTRHARWLNRRNHRQRFDLIMFLEAVIIALCLLSIVVQRPA
jgi:hypothetical protein